jgi:membrane protein DedA with SNARE-associated domain
MAMLASITDTLTTAVGDHGLVAVFLLMAVDAVLPIGGEIVMLFAGVLAAGALQQRATLLGIDLGSGFGAYVALVAAGTIGSLVGGLVGWLIGVRGGQALIERHGRWLHLGPERMARAEGWFEHFGTWAVLVGRLTPLVRSFISIPAGILGSRLGPYAVLTTIASLIWCLVFAGIGWAAGSQWESVHAKLHYLDYAVVVAVIAAVGFLAVRWHRSRSAVA